MCHVEVPSLLTQLHSQALHEMLLSVTGTLCGHIESLTLHGATHLRQSCEREGEHALEKCLRQHMRVLHLEGVPKRGLGAWFLPALSTKCRQLVELDLAVGIVTPKSPPHLPPSLLP